jgi:dUTP pyrophosphatase
MDKIIVKVYNSSENSLPKYETSGAAGMDVLSSKTVEIPAKASKLVPTGLFVEIPQGYEIQVRPRSGLSLKSGLRIANSPGTIDADYRGEICVIVWNTLEIPMVVEENTRIAQLVLQKVPQITWVEVNTKEELEVTDRGAGGFGSTGV